MKNRPVTLTVLVTLLLLVPAVAHAGDAAVENTSAPEDATAAALDALRPIREIRSPLLTLPALTTAGGTFTLELVLPEGAGKPDAALQPADEATDAATCALQVGAETRGPSAVWADTPDLEVRRYEVRVIGDARACQPGAHDLVVTYDAPLAGAVDADADGRDVQPKAVHLVDPARYAALASGEAEPRIVVLADPQVGDPRPFQDGFEDAAATRSPTPVAYRSDGVLGDGTPGNDGRWKAFRKALDAAASENPDFVIVAGDLTFGQAVPGSYNAEYTELYDVLRTVRVPIFLAPGNHDGYVANGLDGFAYWRAFVGPAYYAKEVVPGTHVVVMNTYDWSELDRMGASFAVSSWGGQVRDAQLTWLEGALEGIRDAGPDDRILTVSHHSPSWRQDPYRDADPTGATERADGTPVAEQATRGAVSYGTTDQAWSGENRLALRDVLRAHDVEIAFAGHTHRDRIARDDGAGRIVETHQSSYGMPDDYDPRELHYFDRDDNLIEGYTQEALAHLLQHGDGPLYVDTTTALSGTSQYWGYRVAELTYDEAGDLVLRDLGHPITAEELDRLARHPELFNPDHVAFGLFSKPLEYAMSAPWVLVEDA